MTVYDIILLIALALFVFRGARRGFIASIGGFIGIIIGAWAAGHYYEQLATWLIGSFGLNIMTAIVVSFIAIYVMVNIVISVATRIITRVFRFIPLATTANRLIGAVLGFLEGLLLFGLILWVIHLLPFNNSFTNKLQASPVAKYFEYSASLVQPLLPESLKSLSLLDWSGLKNVQNFTDENIKYIQGVLPNFADVIQKKHQDLQQKADELINSASTN